VNRHLLPSEIDLLVDSDGGFGLAELTAHVEQCAACRARVADGRRVAQALEALPHAKPSLGFSDRLMQRVEVFQPWYVAVWDHAERFVPRSVPLRRAAVALLAAGSLTVTGGGLWLATNVQEVPVIGASLAVQGQTALATAVGDALGTLLGPSASALLRTGSLGTVAIGGVALLSAVSAAALGFGRLAAAARRRQG
jgi:hypothetical protein